MDTGLWIMQAILSAMMLVIGFMKTFQPIEKLGRFSWTTRSSRTLIRFVGVSELLIGIGLILPQLTGILPILTPLAALSICIIMILAIAEHVRNGEAHEVLKNVIIFFVAAFVAVGRFFLLK